MTRIKNKYNGIAVCGKAGTGKDTVAENLARVDRDFTAMSWATGVKELANKITGEDFFDEEFKNQPRSRKFLQVLGTDLMRDVWDDEYWVKLALRAARQVYPKRFPVFTDTRFPNEIEAAKNEGFLVVQLTAPANVREARGRPDSKHESETALDDVEFAVSIDTSKLDARETAEEILKYFTGQLIIEGELFTTKDVK